MRVWYIYDKYYESNVANYFRVVGFYAKEWNEAPKVMYHGRLGRTVISPGTDLAFSRATGFWGSGRDEREAEAE
jgi:hypothetical protein